MRVYVPSTLRDLGTLLDARQLGPAPVDAYAVTAPLASALTDERGRPDDEEMEFVATEDAARASLERLAESDDEQARRVVVVAEVPDEVIRPDPARGESAVVVGRDIPLHTIRAVHVDDDSAQPAVTAALHTIDPERPGEGPDDDTLEALAEHQLLWYASQEIEGLAGRE